MAMAIKVEMVKYRASDGTLWDSESVADERSRLCEAIDEAMLPLGERPDLGHGKWFQHTRDALFQTRRNLWELIKSRHGESYPNWLKYSADDVSPMGIVGRVLSDNDGPLNTAWSRLMRCNFDSFREYDQPYFALNPSESDQ